MCQEKHTQLRRAIDRYAAQAPLDLKTPGDIQRDLQAILGAPHVHQARIGSDECLLCARDLRNDVHKRIAI